MPDHWPPLILGVILCIYWGRVLQMAAKTRRRIGRAANYIPGERTGRILRLIWNPVVAAWIILPFVVAFSSRPAAFLRPIDIPIWLAWFGVVGAAVTLGLTWICWRRMGKSWRMGIQPGEKTELVTTGPYRFVRHPIYALSQALMLFSIVAVPSPAMLALGLVHILLLQWEARREERHLLSVHGPTYQSYLASTGRFCPTLRRSPGR